MSANAVIGVPSWRGKATFSAGAGAWSADYPVTQLGLLPLGQPAVTTDGDPENTRFVVTLTEYLPVQYLCFIGHNAGRDDRFALRAYADEAREDLVLEITDQEFWLPTFPKGAVEYGDPHWWTEKYTDEEIAAYVAPPRPVWLPEPVGLTAIEVDVDLTASAAAAFRCGLFDLGLGTQVEVNYDYGAALGFEARRSAIVSPGGTTHLSDDPEPRTWSGTFAHIPHTVAMGRFFEQRRSRQPFLWLPAPADPATWLQEAWFAEMIDQSPIERAYADIDAVPMQLREVF